MFDDLDLTGIQDDRARQLIVRLLNLLEDVTADLRDAQAEIQRLRDENNRLKGEQGKPTIKASLPKSPQWTTRPSGNDGNPARGRRAARTRRSASTGNKCWQSTRRSCLRMPSSKGTRRWWCRMSCSAPTTSAFSKRSTT